MKKSALLVILSFFLGIAIAMTADKIGEKKTNVQLPEVSETQLPDKSTPPETTAEPVPTVTASAVTAEETPAPTVSPSAAPSGEIDFDKYTKLNKSAVGWGFKKNKGAEPNIFDATKKLFSENNAFYMDQSKPKALYLTFDEGYENGYTGQILDVLKKTGVPAAFFVTGPYLKTQTELIDRMINEGHIVGNHTTNHPNLAKIGVKKAYEEIDSLNKIYLEKYGQSMKYMRPPEGEYSEQLLALAADMGYKTILWSFAYKDWDIKNQKGVDFAYQSTTPYLHDGAVILLHAVSKDNADALEQIINYAKEQGYEFRSLDALQ